jgi:hypothetical protein
MCDKGLCDSCCHVVSVVDRKNSRKGHLRFLTVCVRVHDKDGSDECEVMDEPVDECIHYEPWD